jgi:hypothetical protein
LNRTEPEAMSGQAQPRGTLRGDEAARAAKRTKRRCAASLGV